MSNIEKGLNSLATTINVLLEEDVELPASYKVTLSNILEEVIDMISDLDKSQDLETPPEVMTVSELLADLEDIELWDYS